MPLLAGVSGFERWLDRRSPLINSIYRLMGLFSDPRNFDPVIVTGNQKTGSTAIARLLAAISGATIVPNVRTAWAENSRLMRGAQEVRSFVASNPYYFSRGVVKENRLAPVAHHLAKVLPASRCVFVVRAAAENIRSILDRLGLGGSLRATKDVQYPNDNWRRIVEGTELDIAAEEVVEGLARRWVLINRVYTDNPSLFTLVRYEDFMEDRAGYVRALADRLDLPETREINEMVHTQFQPRGSNRGVAAADFFDPSALTLIRNICAPTSHALGYDTVSAGPGRAAD